MAKRASKGIAVGTTGYVATREQVMEWEKFPVDTTLIGYARVSTTDQRLDLQIDALRRAGVDGKMIFTDTQSGGGKIMKRAGLREALAYLRPGLTLIVWKLDRLGRTMMELITTIERLKEGEVKLKSLTEPQFDTTTAMGQLMFQLFAMLAEYERNLLAERTRAGMAVAKGRGARFGRPTFREIVSDEMILEFRRLVADGMTIKEALPKVGIKRPTYFKHKDFIDGGTLGENPAVDDIGVVEAAVEGQRD